MKKVLVFAIIAIITIVHCGNQQNPFDINYPYGVIIASKSNDTLFARVKNASNGQVYDSANWTQSTPDFAWAKVTPVSHYETTPKWKVDYNTQAPISISNGRWTARTTPADDSGTHYYLISAGGYGNDIGVFLFNYHKALSTGDAILDSASTYLNVPYVCGRVINYCDQEVSKDMYGGYAGIDCSGLVCWTYNKARNQGLNVGSGDCDALWARYGDLNLWIQDAQSGYSWFCAYENNDIYHVGIADCHVDFPPGENKIMMFSAGTSSSNNDKCRVKHTVVDTSNYSEDNKWVYDFGGIGHIR